jgi:hypothetical protein
VSYARNIATSVPVVLRAALCADNAAFFENAAGRKKSNTLPFIEINMTAAVSGRRA